MPELKQPKNTANQDMDVQLLQQAFDYATKLNISKNNTKSLFQDNDMPTLTPSSSSSRVRRPTSKKKKLKLKKGLEKLSSTSSYETLYTPVSKMSRSSGTSWNRTATTTDDNIGVSMDSQTIQKLVQNFKMGSEASSLRKALKDSQNNLATSRNALQHAAKDFFQTNNQQ